MKIQKEQLEVWLMRAPFADYSEDKLRPIIIISNNTYNQRFLDFLGVHMTTRTDHSYSIPVSNSNFSFGSLDQETVVRFDTVTRYEEKLLIKKIGKIKPEFYKQVYEKIIQLIR